MHVTDWNAAALLLGRGMPTWQGRLDECVRHYAALNSDQQRLASITVPGCLSIGSASVRTLSGATLAALVAQAAALPLGRPKPSRCPAERA